MQTLETVFRGVGKGCIGNKWITSIVPITSSIPTPQKNSNKGRIKDEDVKILTGNENF